MVLDPIQRVQLYNALYLKYWDFRVNDDQQRKDRMKHARLLPIESSILRPVVINHSDVTSREDKRMITAIERTYDEVRIKRQTRDMLFEDAIKEIVNFKGLRDWHAAKYGAKYADMEFAEQYIEEEQRKEEMRQHPSLFDEIDQ